MQAGKAENPDAVSASRLAISFRAGLTRRSPGSWRSQVRRYIFTISRRERLGCKHQTEHKENIKKIQEGRSRFLGMVSTPKSGRKIGEVRPKCLEGIRVDARRCAYGRHGGTEKRPSLNTFHHPHPSHRFRGDPPSPRLRAERGSKTSLALLQACGEKLEFSGPSSREWRRWRAAHQVPRDG